MEQVAVMTFEDGLIKVAITNEILADAKETVYVWTDTKDQWLRVGTSAAPLRKRLLSYMGYINKSLAGKKSATPLWEAESWKKLLLENGHLIALAFQPPLISTYVGELRPYLDIERVLIRERKPSLNRSHC